MTMNEPHALFETPDVPDERLKKISTFLLLAIAAILAVLMWIYHGAVISLGFVFLEAQFLLAVSTLGLSATALQKIALALDTLIKGRQESGESAFESRPQGGKQPELRNKNQIRP